MDGQIDVSDFLRGARSDLGGNLRNPISGQKLEFLTGARLSNMSEFWPKMKIVDLAPVCSEQVCGWSD